MLANSIVYINNSEQTSEYIRTNPDEKPTRVQVQSRLPCDDLLSDTRGMHKRHVITSLKHDKTFTDLITFSGILTL